MNGSSDTLDVLDAIHSTRAIRRLSGEDVDEESIWTVLDAAIRGPSGGNSQRWAWIVVRDPVTKQTIGDLYRASWDGLLEGRRARLLRRIRSIVPRSLRPDDPPNPLADDPNFRAGTHLAHHIADAPVWIIAVVRHVDGEPGLLEGGDIFGAIQNLMLAARRLGLGTTLTMLHRQHEREIAVLLDLPPDARTIALIPMGHPEVKFSQPVRKPVETVTHWERFGTQRSRPSG